MENQVVVSEEEQKRNNDMNGRVRHSSSSNNSNYSWDFWELGTSWNNHNHNNSLIFSDQVNNGQPNPHHFHHHHHHQNHHQNHHHTLHPSHTSLYGGERSNLHPDPHLTCLKLGKRHYFEDVNGGPVLLGERHVDGFQMGKRGRSYESFVGLGGGGVVVGGPSSSSPSSTSSIGVGVVGVGMIGSSTMVIPRCQVEGCHVVLVNAKDYHRRHKVCEMHSKAPKVTVLGLEQRFCQQCSRFHMISEFDDAKRSCRRRLAGHNERRRKSSSDSITRNPSQESRLTDDSFSFLTPPTGRALSLLSSKSTSCVSQADISSRSSAALRELIAENRAAVLARQLLHDQNWHQHGIGQATHDDSQVELLTQVPVLQHQFPESSEWDRFQESNAHVTLDLMQTPSSPFGFIPGRSKSKEEEEECCELWKSLEGTNVV